MARMEGFGIEKFNDLIGTRSRHLPASSIAPQPPMLPRAPAQTTTCLLASINACKLENLDFMSMFNYFNIRLLGLWTLFIVRCCEEHNTSKKGSVSVLRRGDGWTFSAGRRLKTDTDPVCILTIPGMDQTDKPGNCECYTRTLSRICSCNSVLIPLHTALPAGSCVAWPYTRQ
jgi:hypothetical protein